MQPPPSPSPPFIISGTMAFVHLPKVVMAAIVFASGASSFSPLSPCNNDIRSRPTRLFSLIKGEAFGEEPFDENEGGVGLAKRTAVKISGVSGRGKGSEARELLRYERIQEIDEGVAKSVMQDAGCRLLCHGTGKELYQDPGSSMSVEDKVIKLAPIEAARAAISSAAAPIAIGEDDKSVVFNFLGGDELIMGEVLEACDLLVEGLDLPAKTRVKFNSISFEKIAADVCSVMVVSSAGKAGGLEGVDESVARGELYIQDGKWFTVTEGDITTAMK